MSTQTINATEDKRFVCPVPGTHFRQGPTTINIAKIDEAQALRLAADPKCKFLYLAADGKKVEAKADDKKVEAKAEVKK